MLIRNCRFAPSAGGTQSHSSRRPVDRSLVDRAVSGGNTEHCVIRHYARIPTRTTWSANDEGQSNGGRDFG